MTTKRRPGSAVMALGVLVVLASSALAQTVDPPSVACSPAFVKGQVVVTMEDGSKQKGTLLCMGTKEVTLAGTGTISLDSIRQIVKPRDSIVDGVLKGASVALIIVAFCGGECSTEGIVRGTLAYATIGGVIDAIQSNEATIYRRGPSASIGWKVRF